MVSGRSCMTRKRCVTLSNRIAIELEDIPGSDVEDKIVLILAKDGKPDEQTYEPADKRSRNRGRLRQHAVIHRQPEPVDDIDYRIQLKDPLILRWYEVERVDDRRDVKPRRQHNLQDVGDVAVVHVGGSKEERHPQSEYRQRQQRDR